ncbi:MAG: MaoC/PaaZ C-terminal domain-containing protein [Nannocystales bacterium]
MAVSTKHVLQQGPVIKTLAGVAWAALRQGKAAQSASFATPSEELIGLVEPLPAGLVKDYIRHVGGDPSSYKGLLPAHLFPQWSFPLASQTLRGVPYPLFKVLNGGCRLQIHEQLPAGVPLRARARLEGIDDNGRRAVLHQRVVTGTDQTPNALTADLYAIVVHDKKTRERNGTGGSSKKKEKARVPHGAEELARWKLRADAGLDFAKLTGDFNPVHWVRPYAKAFGFRNTILHGFSTMARTIETLQRTLFAGSIHALKSIDVQFTEPLVLPHKVGVYLGETTDGARTVYVGDAPGGPAYLVGTFE